MTTAHIPEDLEAFLDAHPLPHNGPIPPRLELISEMEQRLIEEGVDEAEIALFIGCSHTLNDERLFRSTGIFWSARC
jgi:hypothetical protein